MRIRDWSSDVCSSDLAADIFLRLLGAAANVRGKNDVAHTDQGAGQGFVDAFRFSGEDVQCCARQMPRSQRRMQRIDIDHCAARCVAKYGARRSEERRVGIEGVSTCRSRWVQDLSTKKKNEQRQ